jgi:protein AroM
VEFGLLDDLSDERIESLAPHEKEARLVSRLREGKQVLMSERKVNGLLPEAIEFMITEMNVEAIGVLCTHEFPKKVYSCPVIFPAELLKVQIDGISDVQKLGVVVPLESQITMTQRKWGDRKAFVLSKFPYSAGQTWKDIVATLIDEEVDAVVLDCIGFTMHDRDELFKFIHVPILLPRTILASAINRMF